ncbi:hypothetical protein RhiirA4_425070 [Rhizophagus irregularis]|uniref:Uncharacterized protein n=1 Tax=Rhizophagus irregularis TaxID=588596 RepID=A0A2I1GZV8_9GLOM|nr:hypothetical protein RhiirA4_425070 [Rhizophagus irregularis]
MEWEAINIVAIEEVQEEKNLEGPQEVNEWLRQKDNILTLRKRVIELVEEQNIVEHYTTLNDDFTKRLEDVNRYQDEKEAGDKRPIMESPSALERKPLMVEVDENASDESEEEMEKEERKNGKQKSEMNTPNANKKDTKKNKKKNKKK